MSVPRLASVLPAVLLALALAGTPGAGRGEENAPAAADAVLLATDPVQRRRLEAARDYLEVRSWVQAVRLLQAVLDAAEDRFVKLPAGGGRDAAWTSARARAERLLASLPPAGRESYALACGGAAQRMLADARGRADRAALAEVARRFRFTPAGAEALALLGAYHLDRGRPDLAASCYQRLLEAAGPGEVPPRTLAQAALAFHAAGSAQEEGAWAELTRRLRGEGLTVGRRTLSLADLRAEAALLAPPAGPGEDWPLYRGDARRAAPAASAPFVLEPLHRVALASGEARDVLGRAARAAPPGSILGAVPLAVGDRIVCRSADGILALDAGAGRPLWRVESPVGLEALLRDPGKKVQVEYWLGLYGPARDVLLQNSTTGTLSSDGRHVYTVEDLPLPPHPDLTVPTQGGQPRSLGPLRHAAGLNRLRAIDLATGTVAWEVGGPASERGLRVADFGLKDRQEGGRKPRASRPATGNPQSAIRNPQSALADACFLGPPLPLGGDLLVLVEKDQDLSLVCLGPERGEVRWTQALAAAADKMLVGVARRTQAAHLAYGEGVLVCPTHAGAVLGVDPVARTLRWAHVYRRPADAEGTPGFDAAGWHSAWKACAPIIAGGRVVFTAPDGDGVECLRLADGEPLWKSPRGEDDLFVAGVFAGRVLVVGRTACRALSLEDGRSVWQRASSLPAGQGVAGSSGRVYYLPLADGSIQALDLEDPRSSVRIEGRPAGGGDGKEALGNLVFHRGVLWSQGAGRLTAYAPLRDRLAVIEERLARAPDDGPARAERGRLRLDKGDVAGAAADLHEALARPLPDASAAAVRGQLFAALTQLLQQDFPAGEKYLDEYRALCRAPANEEERHARGQQFQALVARGREGQGRVADALRAYEDLLDGARPGDLLAGDDPALRLRPDLRVRGRVAQLARAAAGPGREALEGEVDRRWRAVLAEGPSGDAPGAVLARFLSLFGGVADGPGAAAARQARLLRAVRLAESPYRGHGLEADLLLDAFEQGEGGGSPARGDLAAQALEARARLLTRAGLLDEAAACYRRLGAAYECQPLPGGQTGADVLREQALDKRFLGWLAGGRPPPRWQGARLRAEVLPGGPPPDQLVIPCVPRQPLPPASPGSLGATALPPGLQSYRFLLDGRACTLVALDRDTDRPRFTVPLPLAGLPPPMRGGEVPCQAVDHLLVLAVGPTLLGVDLLERRVRWSRSLLEEGMSLAQGAGTTLDGGFMIPSPDGQSMRRVGWTGPLTRNALLVQGAARLTCLDPASGEVRWVRADVPAALTVFGDGERLYLAEQGTGEGVRSVRAVRADDGTAVPIPEAAARYARCLRVLGRRLLTSEEAAGGGVRLRLYDLPTGKDLWDRTFPAHSVVLDSPAAGWVGVAAPGGAVTVVDLATLREGPKLALEPGHLEKMTAGHLFADGERFYIALEGPGDGKVLDGPHPFFRAGLAAVPVNGMLYAFERAGGALCWYSPAPAQAVLLDRFEELPVVLCAASSTRQGGMPGEGVAVLALRSLDKRTGKVLFARESNEAGDPFSALRLDPAAGTIDLISALLVLRHRPAKP
jgi:outer membrane protein assembly factor BamB